MNATTFQLEESCDYAVSTRRHSAGPTKKSRGPIYGRKRGRSPQQFNGIHRRRRKKITW